MSELLVEQVSAFLQANIQGEAVPAVPAGFPFREAFLDRFVETCPIVVGIPDPQESEGCYQPAGRSDAAGIGLRLISDLHGRSFEVRATQNPHMSAPMGIWRDEFGNAFSSLSTKGNNFATPGIFESSTAPSGFIPRGLQETDSFVRVMRASRIMREAKIDTEMIVRVVEPQHFRINQFTEDDQPIDGQFDMVPLPEFKRRLLLIHWKELAAQPDAIEKFKAVSTAINKMSFFVTLRAMSTGVRIDDFHLSGDTTRTQLENIFSLLNAIKEGRVDDQPLNPTDREDILWYLTDYLAANVGANMANLHKNKLAHTFPTLGNVNACGGLVDLDSVRGEALGLGDEPLSETDFIDDVVFFIEQTDAKASEFLTFHHFVRAMGLTPELDQVDNMRQAFYDSFIANYICVRFNIPDKEMPLPTDEDMWALLHFAELSRGRVPAEFIPIYRQYLAKLCRNTDGLEGLLSEDRLAALTKSMRTMVYEQVVAANETAIKELKEHLKYQDTIDDMWHAVFAHVESVAAALRGTIKGQYQIVLEQMDERLEDELSIWAQDHAMDERQVPLVRALARQYLVEEMAGRAIRPVYEEEAFLQELMRPLCLVTPDAGVTATTETSTVQIGLWAAAMRAHVDLREVFTNLMEDGESLSIKPLPEDRTMHLVSTPEIPIREIIHDGQLIADIEVQDQGETYDVSFELPVESSYVAWLAFNRKTRRYQANILATQPLLQELLDRKIEE